MSGAMPLLPLYAFIMCVGATLPLIFTVFILQGKHFLYSRDVQPFMAKGYSPYCRLVHGPHV